MKKIINGKLYNTEIAELIGSNWNGCSTSDFDYCCEELYVTKKGAYFMTGEGGARSKYATSYGSNTTGGGSVIIPFTKEEASNWAQLFLSPDIVEKYFPDSVEEA